MFCVSHSTILHSTVRERCYVYRGITFFAMVEVYVILFWSVFDKVVRQCNKIGSLFQSFTCFFFEYSHMFALSLLRFLGNIFLTVVKLKMSSKKKTSDVTINNFIRKKTKCLLFELF